MLVAGELSMQDSRFAMHAALTVTPLSGEDKTQAPDQKKFAYGPNRTETTPKPEPTSKAAAGVFASVALAAR